MLNNQNVQVPANRVPISGAGGITERSWYLFFSKFYRHFVDLPNGSFYDTTTQTAPANTPTAITFDSTSTAKNVSVAGGSQITFAADGLTSVTFSIQFTNPSASEDDVFAWIRKNGADVANTASSVTVPKKHGATDGASLMTVNFFENYSAGDVLELAWLTVSGASKITTIPLSISPARPASPGVVLTISQIL